MGEIAPILAKARVLTPLDTETLASYCDCASLLRRCRKELSKAKGLMKGDRPHPLLAVMSRARTDQARIADTLGLTPTARQRLTGVADAPSANGQDDDAAAEFFK